MVMDKRRKSTGILPSQNASSAESKIHGKRRLSNKTEVFQHRKFRIEVLFFSFAIVLIVFYGSLSNTLISLPKNQYYQSYDRVLYQVIPDAERHLDADVPDAFLPQRPRTFGYYFGDSFIGAERLDPNTIRLYDSRGMPDVSARDLRKQQELLDSRDYRKGRATPIEKGDCVAQHEWQKSFYPTCNYVMEQDLTNLWQNSTAQDTYARYLANGYWRDVWTVKEASDETTILKTMRYEHDYTPRNYDRHIRDAVAMERLTSSLYILDIYAFCGNSGLFEFASGGSLTDNAYYSIDEAWTPKETLMVAHQVASGIDAVHHFEKEGVPAIAHTDISPDQYVYVKKDKIFKLNDFNRCRFLAWNKEKDEACTFEVGSNSGVVRNHLYSIIYFPNHFMH
jgi:serine/threonine protein kinase